MLVRVALALALAVVGCEDLRFEAATANGDPSLAKALERVMRAACQRAITCGAGPIYVSLDACIDMSYGGARCGRDLPSGTVRNVLVEACELDVANAPCEEVRGNLRDAFAGSSACWLMSLAPMLGDVASLGELCNKVTICERGSVCDSLSDEACGMCIEAPGEGAPCVDERCAPGLVCDTIDARCRAPGRHDEPCVSGRCAEGHYCRFLARTCRAKEPVGATCTDDSECESNRCDSFRCALRVGEGGPCQEGRECAFGFTCIEGACTRLVDPRGPCHKSSQCKQPGVCVEGHCLTASFCRAVANGETCGDDTACAHGYCDGSYFQALYWDRPPGRCNGFRALGSLCEQDEECGPEAYCGGGERTCVARTAVGEACSESGPPCALGADCLYDADSAAWTCQVPPGLGEPCSIEVSACAGDLVCASDGATYRCAAPLGPGAPCEHDLQCSNHDCSAGACAGPRCEAPRTSSSASP